MDEEFSNSGAIQYQIKKVGNDHKLSHKAKFIFKY